MREPNRLRSAAGRLVLLAALPLIAPGLAPLFSFTASDSFSQPAPEVILPELPFTARQGAYARAAGMGFAHTAVVEDVSSLIHNPAGLAQVRRLEFSGGLVHNRQDLDVGFSTPYSGFVGTARSTTSNHSSATQLGHLALAYPFPAYRGSLVLGVAYQRVASLKSEYGRSGVLLARSGSTPGRVEQEFFTESGGVNYWTAGLGGDLSAHLSLGGSISYIQGHTRQDFEIGRLRWLSDGTLDVNDSDEVFKAVDRRDADLTGWTASAGLLAHVSDVFRVGVNLDLPQKYRFQGTLASTFEDRQKTDDSYNLFEDDITLPLSLTVGGAVTPKNLVIAADVRLTDWTQIDFEGAVRDRDRQYAYRSTVDLNVGAEYQLSVHPTRFRVGFSNQPLPYRIIPAGITYSYVPDDGNPNTTTDASFFERSYPEADITTDRQFITLGAGTLIDEVLMLDVAWVHGSYERSGGGFSEKWTTNRVLATTTFRF